MDQQQKQQYLDTLLQTKGAGLEGVEALAWKVATETAETLKAGRTKLETLRRQVAETEQMLLQVTGRHQGALDMLFMVETERRAAAAAQQAEPEAPPKRKQRSNKSQRRS